MENHPGQNWKRNSHEPVLKLTTPVLGFLAPFEKVDASVDEQLSS